MYCLPLVVIISTYLEARARCFSCLTPFPKSAANAAKNKNGTISPVPTAAPAIRPVIEPMNAETPVIPMPIPPMTANAVDDEAPTFLYGNDSSATGWRAFFLFRLSLRRLSLSALSISICCLRLSCSA